MEEFPPNSQRLRGSARNPRPKVEQVTAASAVRRKKPLGTQFRHVFFGGDARTATEYMIYNVVIPAAKEMMFEAGSAWIEKRIYGESRRQRSVARPNPYGNVAYNQYSRGPYRGDDRPPMPNQLPRASRAKQSFDDIIIPTRQEAEEVLDRMYDLISQYDSASVSDLYELTGIASSHTDMKWGWEDLRGASVGRVRGGGYLLELPQPQPLG
jgi:hypothetical protein